MRRRTLLALPGLGAAAAALAACGGGSEPGEDGGVTSSSAPPVETIRYGDDPSQFGELSRPEGASRGTVVVIHGGFWRAEYDLSLGRPLAADLVGRGWTAFNVEYRRIGAGDGGGGGVPQTLDDVRAAIGTLGAQGVDTTTLVTLGHSAGGHLAAWAGGRVDGVTHVISQAGVLDLVAADRDHLGGDAVEAFLGHHPTSADRDADPYQQIPLAVPVWCVHGDEDQNVPFSQSRDYVAAATAAGATADLVEVAGDHFVLIDPGSDAWARQVEILDSIG